MFRERLLQKQALLCVRIITLPPEESFLYTCEAFPVCCSFSNVPGKGKKKLVDVKMS